jgi:hypothetical protein
MKNNNEEEAERTRTGGANEHYLAAGYTYLVTLVSYTTIILITIAILLKENNVYLTLVTQATIIQFSLLTSYFIRS